MITQMVNSFEIGQPRGCNRLKKDLFGSCVNMGNNFRRRKFFGSNNNYFIHSGELIGRTGLDEVLQRDSITQQNT